MLTIQGEHKQMYTKFENSMIIPKHSKNDHLFGNICLEGDGKRNIKKHIYIFDIVTVTIKTLME